MLNTLDEPVSETIVGVKLTFSQYFLIESVKLRDYWLILLYDVEKRSDEDL